MNELFIITNMRTRTTNLMFYFEGHAVFCVSIPFHSCLIYFSPKIIVLYFDTKLDAWIGCSCMFLLFPFCGCRSAFFVFYLFMYCQKNICGDGMSHTLVIICVQTMAVHLNLNAM